MTTLLSYVLSNETVQWRWNFKKKHLDVQQSLLYIQGELLENLLTKTLNKIANKK